MTRRQREVTAGLVAGLLFGVGLALAGMTLPDKVIGFLDVLSGRWDPSLGLVMVGAIGVHALVYRWVLGRESPIWAATWSLPTRSDVDGRLLLGAALFGAGWGLGGFCPGPGLASIVSGASSSLIFVAAMLVTMAIASRVERALRASAREPAEAVDSSAPSEPAASSPRCAP